MSVNQTAPPVPTLMIAIVPLTPTVPQNTAALLLGPARAPALLCMFLDSTPLAATALQIPTAPQAHVTRPPPTLAFQIALAHLLWLLTAPAQLMTNA